MDINEFFKSHSLESIYQKTNISIEILERIKNKEWDKLKKVQAIGFLRIIEREFGVDLSDLKEECKEFFKNYNNEKPLSPIDLVDAEVASGGGNKAITFVLTVVSLVAIIYAGWYYLGKQDDEEETKATYKGINVDVNSSTDMDKEKKKAIIIEQTQEDSDGEQNLEEDGKRKFNLDSENGDKNGKVVDTKTKKEVETLLNESKDKNSSNKFKLTVENNNTDSNETLTASTEENTTTAQESEKATFDKATIKSNTKKLWLGIYNLSTGKRDSRTIKEPLEIDLSNGDVAVVTGHGLLTITAGDETKKLNTAKKQYILLSKEEGIKFLTKKEYRDLTKKRAW
jgi:hypothetical protein